MNARMLTIVALVVAACGRPPNAPPSLGAVPARVSPVAPLPSDASRITPDAPFRLGPPPSAAAPVFVAPQPREVTLANGIRAHLLPREAHFVAVDIVATGLANEDPDLLGLTAIAMLSSTRRGTTLDDAAANLLMTTPTIHVLPEGVRLHAEAPAKHLVSLLDVLTEIVSQPAFETDAFEHIREHAAHARETRMADPMSSAADMLVKQLRGGRFKGFAGRMRAFTRAEVAATHARVFDPSRLLVAVAGGALEREMSAALDVTVGAIKLPAVRPAVVPAPTQPSLSSARLTVLDQPGATVAYVAAGFRGPEWLSADEVPARLAIHSLVDSGRARLRKRLRDELKLATWVAIDVMVGRHVGVLMWRAPVAADHIGALLTEGERVVRELSVSGPSDDEVEATRTQLTFESVAAHETPGGAVREQSLSLMLGGRTDTLALRARQIAATNAAAIMAAAQRWLDPSKMHVVVSGDWQTVRPQLEKLGWGPVELRREDGTVVAAESARAPR